MKKAKKLLLWTGILASVTAVAVPFAISTKEFKNTSNIVKEDATSSSPGVSGSNWYDGLAEVTADRFEEIIKTAYPTNKISITTTGGTTEEVEIPFQQLSKKWPQEFMPDQAPAVAVYASNIREIVTEIVFSHQDIFFPNLPSGFTLSRDNINNSKTIDVVSNQVPDGKLTLKCILAATLPGSTSPTTGLWETTITGMEMSPTEVSTFAENEFTVTAGSGLEKYIVSDMLTNPSDGKPMNPEAYQKLTEYLNANITKIFDNAPLTAELASNNKFKVERVEGQPQSINIRELVLTKYSDSHGFISTFGERWPQATTSKVIHLNGFSKPNKLAAPKPIDNTILNSIPDITADNPWCNIQDKYSNDFIINPEYQTTNIIPSFEKLVNENKDIFFTNPINVATSMPIVKHGTLNLSIAKTPTGEFDYTKINVTGKFLSLPENPNHRLDDSCYLDMTFVISGFNPSKTVIKAVDGLSVATSTDLSNMIPEQAKEYGKATIEAFISQQIRAGNVFNVTPYSTNVRISNPATDITLTTGPDGKNNALEVKFISTVSYLDNGVPQNNATFKIKLLDFTEPNQNDTTGKNVSISSIALNTGSLVLNGITTKFAKEINTTYLGDVAYNQVYNELKNQININPGIFFNNPVLANSDKNPQHLPTIKEGTEIKITPTLDTSSKYTILTVNGEFLARPENPNDPVNVRNYKNLSFNITEFNDGRTMPKSTPLKAGPSIKDILAEKASEEANGTKIQHFIDNNVNNLLDNAIAGKTTIKIKKKTDSNVWWINQSSSDPSGIVISAEVSTYINSKCEIVTGTPTTMELKMTGFAATNEYPTRGKDIKAASVSILAIGQQNADSSEDFSALMSLNDQMALDFVSVGNNYNQGGQGWGAKGTEFMKGLIKIINAKPADFFENPVVDSTLPYVEVTNDAFNQPIAKPMTEAEKNNPPLTIECVDGVFTKLKVTGRFLTRPDIVGEESTYKTQSFMITDFNNKKTMQNPEGLNVKNTDYKISDGSEEKFIYDYSVGTFIQNPASYTMLATIVEENIRTLLLNTSYSTKMISVVTPIPNPKDPTHTSISIIVDINYYSSGGGVIVSNKTESIECIIKGFAKPETNTNLTAPLENITTDTLAANFNSKNYKYIGNLGKYYYADFINGEGYDDEAFSEELNKAINENPSVFFENPVLRDDPTINPTGFPVVKVDKVTKKPFLDVTGKVGPDAVPELTIKGTFLTQPDLSDTAVTEDNYKPLEFIIRNGTSQDFYKNHKTALNTANMVKDQLVFDLNNPAFVKDSQMASVTLDDINNDPDSIRDTLIEFVSTNMSELFINVLRNETRVLSASVDQSFEIDFINKQVAIQVSLEGVINQDGSYQNASPLNLQFYLKGFKESSVVSSNSSSQNMLTTIAIGAGACLGAIFIAFIIIFVKSKKVKNIADDTQYGSFY